MSRNLEDSSGIAPAAYSSVAIIIFAFVSFTFFFPVNAVIPLDRRSCAVVGATCCYLSRMILFPSERMDLVEAIDFDVLVLLAGIMVVNFVVVHQQETKNAILYIQKLIWRDPRKGFWATSLIVFLSAPFLTNDGVCLLFVEPIMEAFCRSDGVASQSPRTAESATHLHDTALRKSDGFYFLIALACSSNIGSALTYTGNPQNMMVAEDSIEVLPPIVFLFHMFLPTCFCWVTTTLWIERCWDRSRAVGASSEPSKQECGVSCFYFANSGMHNEDEIVSDVIEKRNVSLVCEETRKSDRPPGASLMHSPRLRSPSIGGSPFRTQRSFSDSDLPKLVSEQIASSTGVISKIIYVVSSPFPYAMCLMLSVMIALIFADVISIAGLVVCAAAFMVIFTVLGNHWQGQAIWGTEGKQECLTSAEKKKNTNEFFERLFSSLDYSLLILFAGLFVVLENIASTGIPGFIWSRIVGDRPFKNTASVAGICFFVLLSSQFLGNVPVIQLAKPNVEYLDDDDKRYAWAILSFVATIGGNLTITGSAANIIVAEKANRLDPTNAIDFFSHFRVCFLVTLLSCAIGVVFITGTMMLQNFWTF